MMGITLGRNGHGVLRMVDGQPGHLSHWCEGCEADHIIDIHAISQNGKVTGWDGDFNRPTIGEPVSHSSPLCEYLLKAGVLYYLESCHHELRGKSRHLKEI